MSYYNSKSIYTVGTYLPPVFCPTALKDCSDSKKGVRISIETVCILRLSSLKLLSGLKRRGNFEVTRQYVYYLLRFKKRGLVHVASGSVNPKSIGIPVALNLLIRTINRLTGKFLPLKAKLACHLARCLLPVEILERCGLATGPATVKLLSYLLLN